MKTNINLNRTESELSQSESTHLIIRRLLCLVLMPMVAGVLASCASVDGTSCQYAGVPHYSPTSPGQVEILRTQPKQSHQRIGEVVIEASTEPAPQVGEIEQKLRKEAARLGADAVIVVQDTVEPERLYFTQGYYWNAWNQFPQTYEAHKIVGVAIKYQGAPNEQQLTPTGAP